MPVSEASKERKRQYQIEYRRRPEVKAKMGEYQRNYRDKNPEKTREIARSYARKPEVKQRMKELSRGYWVNDWAKYKLKSLKTRARREGMDFDLEESDLILPDTCPVFGIPLVIGEGKLTSNSPSVDRINNSKGYIKGNVVVVSHKANSMKRAATLDEMQRLVAFYEPLLKR